MVYFQIWLNPAHNDPQFFYIFQVSMDDYCHLAKNTKIPLKKTPEPNNLMMLLCIQERGIFCQLSTLYTWPIYSYRVQCTRSSKRAKKLVRFFFLLVPTKAK
jgi:hypothetical protein